MKTKKGLKYQLVLIVREEADKFFYGLSAGGDIESPMDDSPWGTYAGMFRDKYGIEWIVEFDPNYNG